MKRRLLSLVLGLSLFVMSGCQSLFPQEPTGSRGVASAIQEAIDEKGTYQIGVAYLDSLNQWYGSFVDNFRGANTEILLAQYPEVFNDMNIGYMMHYLEINQYLYNNIPNDRYSDQVEATYLGTMVSDQTYQGITVVAFRNEVTKIIRDKQDAREIVAVLRSSFNYSAEYFWVGGRYIVSCDASFLEQQNIDYATFDQLVQSILEDN